MKFRSVVDVVRWRLCVGCGACVTRCEKKNISLENVIAKGIRPRVKEADCEKCGKCLDVCPGLGADNDNLYDGDSNLRGLREGWGPILEVWEGYAADPEIRLLGSSGGIATALALYCIEKKDMAGALHTGPASEEPLTNKTAFSVNRSELLARTGSRYSPASPCDSLDIVETSDSPCVFIGKPCDVTGLRKYGESRPQLARNVGLVIGIFCAGTPASQGTVDFLRKLNIDPTFVEELRYRGRGWPGRFSVRLRGEESCRELSSYMDAWGFVQKYRPYRCYLCPDGTSEFADVSCGDPWYRELCEEESGQSLVLVRTEKGRDILESAMNEGYIIAERRSPRELEQSQQNLLDKRGAIWGRLVAMQVLGIPTPSYEGFSLFENWLNLSLKEKVRSILGTVRRSLKRKYYRPEAV